MYLFKPNQHWNIISKEQYEVLSKFYNEEKLKYEEVEDD